MKTTLCTLYNSLYLDKGLVLYDSLKECAKDFELYVLCMDEKCYEVISDIGEESLKPIHLHEVENEEMLIAKGNRSTAEYCWTCSSRLIKYILETYKPECCIYIDADMYFYHDPSILVEEMYVAGKSVMMVPHRFTEKTIHLAKKVGVYCVEFNCFCNNKDGLKVLNHWHNKCLDCCSNLGDGVHWGDQKYMDEWPVLFPSIVHVCENLGAGVASWNITSYDNYSRDVSSLRYKETNVPIPLVFYHFASLKYHSRHLIDTSVICCNNLDYRMVKDLYKAYLMLIDKKKDFLIEKHGIDTLIKRHPSLNNNLSLKQKLSTSYFVSLIRSYLPFLWSGRPYIIKI